MRATTKVAYSSMLGEFDISRSYGGFRFWCAIMLKGGRRVFCLSDAGVLRLCLIGPTQVVQFGCGCRIG